MVAVNGVIKSLDEIPMVCLEQDLAAIFRLSLSGIRWWRKYSDFLPFPPLPSLDRQTRVSGRVVAWFLAQDAEYYRRFKAPLQEAARGTRRRKVARWQFTSPHAPQFRVAALAHESATLGVADVAQVLRASEPAIRRAAENPEFPMPPASARPLRWTDGQLERLLWAPSDHEEFAARNRRRTVRLRR